MKCLVSEWHGTPRDAVIDVRFTGTELATRTHTKNSCTAVMYRCHQV